MPRLLPFFLICWATLALAHANVRPIDPPPASGPVVYVTKTGEKYHRNACHHLAHSKRALKLSEAKKNYDPCKVCQPPR